jgi:tetratricopeptide (TPR) repeat protein
VPDVTVWGTLVGEATEPRVRVTLSRASGDPGPVGFEQSLGPGGSELPQALATLGEKIRAELGATMSSEQSESLLAARVRSSATAQLHAEGISRARSFEYDRARDLFQAAIARESSFLPARLALEDAWLHQGEEIQAREVVKSTLGLKFLTDRERAERSAMLAVLEDEFEKAAQARLALLEARPDDIEDALDLLGFLHVRGPSALTVVQRLRQLSPPASGDVRLSIAEGNALVRVGRLGEARAALEKAIARARELGDRSDEAAAHRQLAVLLWRSERRLLDAVPELQEAERLFRSIGDVEQLAGIRKRTALLLTDLGPTTAALAALREAAALQRKLGNRHALAFTSAEIAGQHLERGELREAWTELDTAAGEFKALGHPVTAGIVLLQSRTLLDQGDLAGAQAKLSVAKASLLIDERGVLGGEVPIFLERDLLPQAVASVERLLALDSNQGSDLQRYNVLIDSCRLRCQQGDVPAGMACLQGVPASESLGLRLSIRLPLARAFCANRAGDRAEAEKSAQLALAAATKAEQLQLVTESRVELLRAVAGQGQTTKALSGLRAELATAEKKQQSRAAMEISLALGEVEVRAGVPGGRPRLERLEREARAREFLRIARLAREAQEQRASR